MKIKIWLAVTIVALLGWTGFPNLVRFTKEHLVQQQVLAKVKMLVTEARNYDNTLNIDSLQANQTKLKQAISTLEKVPNLPGFSYQQAQNDLAQLRPLLDTVEKKLNTEEQALVNLESAHNLNTEAVKLVLAIPFLVEGSQQAKSKWQEAVNLLESIPAGTFVSAQAKDGMATCRHSLTAVVKRLASEDKALERLGSATEVVQKAASITTDSPHTLEDLLNAQSQWQLANKLLSSIPSGTTVSTEAEQQLIYYQSNFLSVSKALNQLKQCIAQSSYSESSCEYDVTVNIVTPPIATASNSDSQHGSESSTAKVTSSPTSSAVLGYGPTGYSLSKGSNGCISVKGITEADLARLNTDIRGYKKAVKETGSSCVLYE